MAEDSNEVLSVGAPTAQVLARRNDQLRRWDESATAAIDLENPKLNKIRFEKKFMFLDSVTQQDVDEVKELLRLDVDVNHTNPDGISALHQVSIDGNVEIAKILLENNAFIDALDNDGWSPLHACAQCGFTELARLLLESGANVATVDNEGELPIDKAEEHDMRELLSTWMRRRSIDINTVRTAEEQELIAACEKVVNSRDKKLEAVTIDGATILHCAAAKGLPDIITMLARAGVDLNAQDNDGWTALHAAAHWCQPEAIEALIQYGADLFVVNTFAENALDIADEDVKDMLQVFYNRAPRNTAPLNVPGVGKFLNPKLPDISQVQPIIKGSRAKRKKENKENEPQKLAKLSRSVSKPEEEPTKDKVPAVKRAEVNSEKPLVPKDNIKGRFDSAAGAAAVDNKPSSSTWRSKSEVPEKEPAEPVPDSKPRASRPWEKPKEEPKPEPKPERSWARKTDSQSSLSVDPKPEPPASAPTPTATEAEVTKAEGTGESASGAAEVVRKKVARRKRDERRSTQHVSLDDLPPENAEEEDKKKKEAAKKAEETNRLIEENRKSAAAAAAAASAAAAANGLDNDSDGKKKTARNPRPMIQITDTGMIAFEDKKSEEELISPESASAKPELVRKKVARRKRDERRSTQHVSADDIKQADSDAVPTVEVTVTQPVANDTRKEDHLARELELEKKRFEESAAMLLRHQEDLRKKENKIQLLEKENERMKSKTQELEEDLRALQTAKQDNQRLRDENAALIRVIGKLSRNPL